MLLGKGTVRIGLALANVVVPVPGKEQSGIGRTLRFKLTPPAMVKIVGFMLGFAWLLACFATFANSAPEPLYGSRILYGFGVVFTAATLVAWFAAMSAKATARGKIVAIACFGAFAVAAMVMIPSTVTLPFAGATLATLFVAFAAMPHVPKAWRKAWLAPRQEAAPQAAVAR